MRSASTTLSTCGMPAAALGGKPEQRHRRLGVDQTRVLSAVAMAISASCTGVGLDHHGAIGERHQPVVAERAVLQRHDEDARDQPRRRARARRVQRRAHRFGGGVDRAAHAAIGIARPHHQRREVERLAAPSAAASTCVMPLARRRSW